VQQNLTEIFREQIRLAAEQHRPLRIVGSDSKHFLGTCDAERQLKAAGHRGITDYEPSELVIRARAGTPLAEIQQALRKHRQKLAFEPPSFGPQATLGGTIACNLSGPARPFAGAARDHVLGCRIINGKGEVLRFGGEVIKNVAGYDASRLMCGAYGTLGLMLDISLRVVPLEEAQITLVQSCDSDLALQKMTELSRRSLPITGLVHHQQQLYIRIAGNESGVVSARQQLGGDRLAEGEQFWQQLREQQLAFFHAGESPLWRLSLPSNRPPLELPGEWLLDWGGAQRWLRSDASADQIRACTAQQLGHATLWQGSPSPQTPRFTPLPPALLALHQRLKQAFDPNGIFNPGRMYTEL